MAAFTEDEQAQIFEIFGVPQGGSGVIVTSLSHLPPSLAAAWEATWSAGDFSGVVTQILAHLNAATEAQRTRVRALLTQWTELAPTGTLQLRGAVQVDMAHELDRLRASLGNLLGVAVPPGGFLGEARRALHRAGDR